MVTEIDDNSIIVEMEEKYGLSKEFKARNIY